MSKDNLYFESLGSKFEEWSDSFDVERRRELFRRMISTVPPSGSAVEIGCGYGALTGDFMGYFESLTVLDISDQLTRQVSSKFGIQGRTGTALQLPFPDESVDNIVSSECIEHTGDPIRAVHEMCRVLKHGGVVYLSTPNKLWGPLIRLGSRLKIRRFQDREKFVSARQITRSMEACGIEVLHRDSCHLVPWQLPMAKWLIRKTDRYGSVLYPFSVNIAVVGKKV